MKSSRSAQYVLLSMMFGFVCFGFCEGRAAAAQRQSIRDLPVEGQYAVSAAIGQDDPVYHARLEPAGLEAINAGQNYTARFGERGISILAGQAGFSLEPVAWGRGDELALLPQGSPQAVVNAVVRDRGAVAEWYVNGPLGLQQGFTVSQRPQPGAGPLTIAMALTGARTGMVDADGRGVVLTSVDGARYRYSGLMVRDAHGVEAPARLAVQSDALEIRVDDAGLCYPLSIDPIIQAAKLTASDGAANDRLGYSVAISGDTVVVGAYMDDVGANTDQGSAYIFLKSASGWATMTQTAKLTASDGAAGDHFGWSVAISGDTVVVGSNNHTVGANAAQGTAYVFLKPSGGWANMTETATLTALDGAAHDMLGISVAISGDTVVAGAYGDGPNVWQGSAYIFSKPAGGWSGHVTQTAKLTASDGAAQGSFGYTVAASGDTIAVGATGWASFKGAVYVFSKPAGPWTDMTQSAKLTADDAVNGDNLGCSLAISGDTIIAGAAFAQVGSNTSQGAAYVFAQPAGGWSGASTQSAKLTAPDGAAYDMFGCSVALGGETAVVGAYAAHIGTNSGQGAAYVYEKPAGGWVNMTQATKLTAADGAANDNFGQSVAFCGSTLVVGANLDDAGATTDQGSAYIFENFAEEPDEQAINVMFSSVTDTAMTIHWSPGTGSGSIVLMKAGAPVDAGPVDKVDYAANAIFGTGSQIGTGNYVVYAGAGDTVTVTGLSASTAYYVAVYDYNGSASQAANYRQIRPATGSRQTSSAMSAAADAYSTSKGVPLVTAAPGVLANDTGSNLSALEASGPAHGSLTLAADGSFTYIPASGYSGSDSFTYKVTDGIAESAPATVTITVAAGGACPAVKIYGEGSGQVELLRRYRDEVLGQTAGGRILIQWYYKLAPSAEGMLDKSPVLQRIARNAINALLPLMQKQMN